MLSGIEFLYFVLLGSLAVLMWFFSTAVTTDLATSEGKNKLDYALMYSFVPLVLTYMMVFRDSKLDNIGQLYAVTAIGCTTLVIFAYFHHDRFENAVPEMKLWTTTFATASAILGLGVSVFSTDFQSRAKIAGVPVAMTLLVEAFIIVLADYHRQKKSTLLATEPKVESES